MSEQLNTTIIEHNIPDDCVGLISEAGYKVLKDNRMIIEILPSDYCPRLPRSSFAALYSQVPNIDEKDGRKLGGGYTTIRVGELGETLQQTAAAVLARKECQIEDTHYWAVYLQELAIPNEKGLTKVFTYDPNGNAFAGFGYRDIKDIGSENIKVREQQIESELLEDLYLTELWLNNKMVEVVLRDADSGLLITNYKGIKIKNGIDNKLIRSGHIYAENYRQRVDYESKKAEHTLKVNTIPEQYQPLLSRETERLLAERDIVIKVSDEPSYFWIGGHCDKLFAVEAFYPSRLWFSSSSRSGLVGNIERDDIKASVHDTAVGLMAKMGGNADTMSYWVIYYHETKTPYRNGYTKMYTTDVEELPAGGGHLAGIAISYNYGITPMKADASDRYAASQKARVEKLEAMSEVERSKEIEAWWTGELNLIKQSLVSAERKINENLLSVSFRDRQTSDSLGGFGFDAYPKEAIAFNNKLQMALKAHDDEADVDAAELAQYLSTAV